MKGLLTTFTQLRAAYANKTGPEGLQLLARIYWRLILVLGIVVILISAVLGTIQLLNVLGTFGEPPQQHAAIPVTLEAEKLDAGLSDFASRKQRFEALQSSTSTAADPSRSF